MDKEHEEAINSNKMDLNQLVSKNQSIKIVPSFEDTVRSLGLDTDLEQNIVLWYNQLKITWKTWKKSAAIENHIKTFFQSNSDSHRLALVFIIKGEDSKDCKPKTLPYFIIQILHAWSQSSKMFPEDKLKIPAFHIAIHQRNQHFLNLMVKTYQLNTIKEYILPIIKDMIKNDNCKQASQIVLALEAFDDIPVENLMFPLVLQDKPNIIDEYLLECPDQVEPFLIYLDRLLDKSFNIREYVQRYLEENTISNVKYDRIHYRPLGKLVARLCNKFKKPIEMCKNLSKNRTTGGLRYLVHQKYVEKNVSTSVWDDLVKDSLRQNEGSALEFIDMLIDYDKKEALKWAEYLNMPQDKYPLAIQKLSLEEQSEDTEDWDEEVSTGQDYYKLSLPEENIIFINSGEQFYDMMISKLKMSSIVSVDCEWKPSFGATQSQVALVQVATHDHVYLIDSLLLNKQEYASFWLTFSKSLLDNAEIIKIGFGLEQDLKELKASIIGLGNIKVKGEGLLDLNLLWKSLITNGLVIPGNNGTCGNSLTSLVQTCFGLPLEKSEQCSNWELRPLRKTQIQYAALDAHVLIDIFNYLQNLCIEQDIQFDEICNDVMLETKKKISKKSKNTNRKQIAGNFSQAISAQNVKFFIEPSLSHLISYMRFCGIDTMLMPISMLWYDIINVATIEERLILVSKLKCTPTVNYPQSSILDVGNGSVVEQLQRIFSTFNILVIQKDLLNRCIVCNELQLKNLNPEEVYKICEEYKAAAKTNFYEYSARNDNDNDHENYDDFLSDSDDDQLELYQPINTELKQNTVCKTSKGAKIDISNVDKLSTVQKPALLCESCGKLYWENDELIVTVNETIENMMQLRVW